MYIEKNSELIVADLVSMINDSFSRYLRRKLSNVDFSYRTFNYIKQKHYKAVKKAHDLHSIILNYIYWNSIIERRTMIERLLIKEKLGSPEKLNQIIDCAVARRDQMVRRLLYEYSDSIEIEVSNLIYKDIVEIKIKNINMFFYVKSHVISKIGVKFDCYQDSKNAAYLPFIIIDLPLLF